MRLLDVTLSTTLSWDDEKFSCFLVRTHVVRTFKHYYLMKYGWICIWFAFYKRLIQWKLVLSWRKMSSGTFVNTAQHLHARPMYCTETSRNDRARGVDPQFGNISRSGKKIRLYLVAKTGHVKISYLWNISVKASCWLESISRSAGACNHLYFSFMKIAALLVSKIFSNKTFRILWNPIGIVFRGLYGPHWVAKGWTPFSAGICENARSKTGFEVFWKKLKVFQNLR